MIDSFRQRTQGRSVNLPLQLRNSQISSISNSLAIPYLPSNDTSCHQPEIMASQNSIQGSAIKIEGAQSKIKQLLNKPVLTVGMLKKNVSHLSLKHQLNNIQNENCHNTKSSNCLPLDFAKEVPKLKLNQAFNERNLDAILSGRRHIEKAYNKKNQVIVTHDNRSYQMLQDFSNLNLDQKSSRREGSEGDCSSLDNHFKRRASSTQSKALTASKCSNRSQLSNKKHLANNILGVFQKNNEVSSYKKDAANLLTNRIQKKLRQYFYIMLEFALFQEEIQAMKKFDSQFDIQRAFESFKKKQEEKGCRVSQINFSKTQVFSCTKGKAFSQCRLRDNKENIFLSQDKINMQRRDGKLMKDTTPVNIFQTYLQGQTTVSPIDYDYRADEFEAVRAVDDDWDLDALKSSKLTPKDLKTSFKEKIKGLKSDFSQILSQRTQEGKPLSDAFERVNKMVNTQRVMDDEKENIEENFQNRGSIQRVKGSKLAILKQRHSLEQLEAEFNCKKTFPKETTDKLLELMQIKELKMKFFGMFNFKQQLKRRDQLDSLSELSNVNPGQIQTRLFTRESGIINTHLFDEEKNNANKKLHKILNTVFSMFEYKAQKEKKKCFFTWQLKSRSGNNEVKTEILKQIIEQKLSSQKRKGFGCWKFIAQNNQASRVISRQQSLEMILFSQKLKHFKSQHHAFRHWKQCLSK